MPVLLQVFTEDFELTVWSSDISRRQATYQNTLISRSCVEPSQPAGVRLSAPACEVRVLDEHIKDGPVVSLELANPLFFENTEYQFEWIFYDGVTRADLVHRRQLLNASFRFVPAQKLRQARLTGSIQTGNDVGWLRLPLRYTRYGHQQEYAIAFEVLPTKMLLHHDLPAMYRAIDDGFPLWRFSLAEKTEQDAASSRQRGNFPLLWLAQFSRLREQFEEGLKIICQAPHSRLQTQVSHVRADRFKGRIRHRLGERVHEDLRSNHTDRHYRVEKKQLSVNTPENRFIKMVVNKSQQQLSRFEQRLRANNQVPESQRLSDAFLNELHNWQIPMQKMLNRSFLKEVDDYSGMSRESLVLQQKTGYSSVYRIWQELKFYLDVLAGQSQISMKSVAEIYEIWCFLRIRQMLLEQLGFEEVAVNKTGLELNDFFEYRLKDGFAGAFEFVRKKDGVIARLAHEPRFTNKGEHIRSYLITQKPDIVLEVIIPNGDYATSEQRFIWLFDAKYRIKTERSQYDEDDIDISRIDYVPDDAINQMHRYRDALIALHESSSENYRKSRPVFGAFALYPGYFQQENTLSVITGDNGKQRNNPYTDAIREVGIGAFPLLPDDSSEGCGGQWLLDFLREQLGNGVQTTELIFDRLYVQDAARIPVYGMTQVLYKDLCMTSALGSAAGRKKEYFERFEQGTARWYHMPQSTFIEKYQHHVIEEIRYLALARTSPDASGSKQIDFVWPVLDVTVVPRNQIDVEQAGSLSSSEEKYYLFKLGEPLAMNQPLRKVPHRPQINSMRLTTLKQLQTKILFSELPAVYIEALKHSGTKKRT